VAWQEVEKLGENISALMHRPLLSAPEGLGNDRMIKLNRNRNQHSLYLTC
jgi:hypothetical protein